MAVAVFYSYWHVLLFLLFYGGQLVGVSLPTGEKIKTRTNILRPNIIAETNLKT